jgi:hypothetical protein
VSPKEPRALVENVLRPRQADLFIPRRDRRLVHLYPADRDTRHQLFTAEVRRLNLYTAAAGGASFTSLVGRVYFGRAETGAGLLLYRRGRRFGVVLTSSRTDLFL